MYMRNRYYDPATGRFTQQDPIGLAGGLNLYGFANGDPVNFNDPFGLKVEFVGDEARALYGRLRQAANNAANSRSRHVAAAGRHLLGMLDALEETEEVVTIQIDPDAEASGFGPRQEPGVGGYGITLAPFKQDPSHGLQIKLAHELGHAYAVMIDGRPGGKRRTEEFAIRSAENRMRTIWGCSMRIFTHGTSSGKWNPVCP
jgi:hypothetical protein